MRTGREYCGGRVPRSSQPAHAILGRMRIAYLVHFRGGPETGIFRKVTSQADAWSRLGKTVGMFVTTDAASVEAWRSRPEAVRVIGATTKPGSLLTTREGIVRAVRRWKPDVVYARHTLFHPGLLFLVRERPTVFEINSDDLAEFRSASARRHQFARLTRGLLLRRAAGLVFVTRELARMPQFARYRRPSVVIANGVRLVDVPAVPPPDPPNAAPRLIFLGHPHSPWHGLDQLEAMAAAFPDWEFDVVGPGPVELTRRLPNLRAHGVLQPAAYRPILARADVAIGSLGLYRNGMEEASPIKLREYLAAGVPTIIGYEDTDFPDDVPFLLRVPNRDGGAVDHLGAVRAFVEGWRGRRVPRDAIGHLDMAAKEQARLTFLVRVAAAPQR